jgi:hypothetical protein
MILLLSKLTFFFMHNKQLNSVLEAERAKLEGLLTKKVFLYNQRKPLLEQTWKRDADDIYQAFGSYSVDKMTLVKILATVNSNLAKRIIADN